MLCIRAYRALNRASVIIKQALEGPNTVSVIIKQALEGPNTVTRLKNLARYSRWFAPYKLPEVQKHGFSWEKDLIRNVYGVTDDELKLIKYTSKMDLPRSLNRKDAVDVSFKTTCSPNAVCMADCLRVYDAVSSANPFHMTVVYYRQCDEKNTKNLISITEVVLTGSTQLLFGSITREELAELDRAVKTVPQKRSPTADEYRTMYAIRDRIQVKSGAIHLDIKCNSQQSRLQCSFNRFQQFLKDNPERIVEQSTNGYFRGGHVTETVSSSRRVLKKSAPLPEPDSAPH